MTNLRTGFIGNTVYKEAISPWHTSNQVCPVDLSLACVSVYCSACSLYISSASPAYPETNIL